MGEATNAPTVAPVRRGRLVPVLLVVLNVGVLVVLFVLLGPKINLSFGGGESEAVADLSNLDPKLLLTREGRKLSPVVFGNLVFEVTRVAYHPDVRSRTVTISVPGSPPESALFRVGDSFGHGRVRVVEILRSGVVLEHNGKQQAFGLEGAELSQDWHSQPSPGLTMIPPRSSVVPDLPQGHVRPAIDPRQGVEAGPVSKATDAPEIESLEDLPLETLVGLDPADFKLLTQRLAEIFERDLVLAPVLEPESHVPFGLEIKNIKAECPLAQHGLRTGDIILYLNGEDIRRIADLNVAAAGLHSATQVGIEVMREGEQQSFIFVAGEREEPASRK